MRQHVLPGVTCSQSVSETRSLTVRNVAGHYMTLTRPPLSARSAGSVSVDEAGSGQQLTVEGAHSTVSDIMASNGVLHVIDKVLFHNSGTYLLY